MSTAGGLEQLQGATTLSLKLAERKMESLFLLLQNGFFIEAFVGCTIKDFFLKQLGLSPDYAEVRIQGIFLDGKPADDIDTAIIRDGARLTVSGTMPGLVGIALRRGPLAVFRHSITHRETGDYDYKGKGIIKLKLLNLLMKEMGPGLLKKGIYMNSSELADYLGKLPADFWQECTITMDGKEVSVGLFQEERWLPESKLVKFSIVPKNC
ncbi:hypothetical protein ACFLZ5_11935 [Thermodesulfobacteriota bacterium]